MKKLVLVLMTLFLFTGCATKVDSDKIQVTATTNMIKDLVEVVGGNRVEVYGMMKAGVDPHAYKARPSDVSAIQNADIIAFNGVNLEAKLAEVFTALPEMGYTTIKLEDGISPEFILVDPDLGAPDPHIWFNVEIWQESAQWVAKKLGEYEPENAQFFQDNADAYVIELDELIVYIQTRLKEIPRERRVLVTAHDAFTYFGAYFDMEVKAVQGINSQTEAGIADINNLADEIAERKIKSIYTESSIPIKTIQSMVAAVRSRGYDIAIGGELYSDSLKDQTSYINSYKINVDTMVDGLK